MKNAMIINKQKEEDLFIKTYNKIITAQKRNEISVLEVKGDLLILGNNTVRYECLLDDCCEPYELRIYSKALGNL